MLASGLTHGGFYRHFASKNELVVEAIGEAFGERGNEMRRRAEKAPAGKGWKAIVKWYLSEEHCLHPETGCPLAALAPELARIEPAAAAKIAEALKGHRETLLPYMPGRRRADREAAYAAIMSTLSGAMQIARLLPDPSRRKRLLKDTRKFLLGSFE